MPLSGNTMKKLPVDISTFSKMINEDYLYIDKTRHIYDLFKTGERYFFLSRPRRFGKSLLISTLKELFLGKKELFKDLWIGKQADFDWQEHPVIHLDLSDADTETAAELKISLGYMLDRIADSYQVDIAKAYSPKTKLKLLVEKLSVKNSVVILIDEYDKPILDHLHNPKRAEMHRATLKSFYDGFKGLDAFLRAVFITGVSKFSRASIFSGLNNLNELSNEPEGSQLVGYTEAELIFYFKEYIEIIAKEEGTAKSKIIEKIRYWYNGYQFSEAAIKIYNPFSIVYFFKRKKFRNYWFQTGTPSFLVELLKKRPEGLGDIEKKAFTLSTLGTFRLDKIPLETLFFQAGYLTIKEYDSQFDVYKLGYPNEEVKQSLSILEIGALTDSDSAGIENTLFQIKFALEHKDLQSFMCSLECLLAGIPYNLHIESEAYYHSLFQLLCNVLSLENQCELATSKGRIDLVVKTAKYLYIFEFKLNKSADAALRQIVDKQYYERYLSLGKEIVLVGISFNYKRKKLSLNCSVDTPSMANTIQPARITI